MREYNLGDQVYCLTSNITACKILSKTIKEWYHGNGQARRDVLYTISNSHGSQITGDTLFPSKEAAAKKFLEANGIKDPHVKQNNI